MTRGNTILARLTPWLILAPSLVAIGGLVILPLAFLFRFSFYKFDPFIVMRPAFVLDHYVRLLAEPYPRILVQTLVYGAVVTLVTLVLAFPVAYTLARMRSRWRRVLLALVVLPLTLSVVVVVFGWIVLLGQSGLVNRLLLGLRVIHEPVTLMFRPSAVIIALSQAFMAYQVLSLLGVIGNIDASLEEAAENLGASRFWVFMRVLLPLAKPGMLAGSTFVFLATTTAFVTPRIIGGGRVQMLGTSIYQQIYQTNNWPLAAALSFVLLVVALVTVAGFERLARQEHIELERRRF